MRNEIFGKLGDDTIIGTSRDDAIIAASPILDTGTEIIYGGAGDDLIVGLGPDMIYGEDGNDGLLSYGGGGLIDGGPGNDRISLHNYGNGTFDGESTLLGGLGDDRIENESGFHAIIRGGEGNDEIIAMPNDIAEGGPGDDSISGKVGSLQYNGNYEDYSVSSSLRGILTGRNDMLTGFEKITIVEDLREGSPDGKDTIFGYHNSLYVFSDVSMRAAELPCYVAGTRILTQSGEVPIEALSPGDLVVTCLGQGTMLKPVVWTGRRRVTPALHPEPRRARPIRIRQGALAEGVPQRDLLVSPSHALFIEGHLVHAESLVNGATITQEAWPEVEYLHVELADHDVILAEGTPAETYRDDGNRAIFGPTPVTAPVAPPPLCAPFMADTAPLARALMARAGALGWRRMAQPSPWLLLDGQTIHAEAPGRYRLPPGGKSLRLLSPAARLGAMASGTDGRILGLALVRLTLDTVTITADDPRLIRGFHGLERGDAGAFRWTDGDADLTAALSEALPRGGMLHITDCGASPAWVAPAEDRRLRA